MIFKGVDVHDEHAPQRIIKIVDQSYRSIWIARRLVVYEPYDDSLEQRSLVQRKLALYLGDYFVPLVVAHQSIFTQLNKAAC